jgi:uncharacterized repeat protein (TIGR03803 family)
MNTPVFSELPRWRDRKREIAERPAQRSTNRASVGALLLGIFCAASAQGQYEVLHTFNLSDGASPISLIQGSDGNFYGTAAHGGNYNRGTLFRMSPGGVVTVLHHFDGSDGAEPARRLVEGSDGNFYGTTTEGGASNLGAIFRMSPACAFDVLHHFSSADGEYPGGLIEASDGNYYGTTYYGGSSGCGTVFRMSSSGIMEVPVLHSFTCPDGGPDDRLLEGSDGNFYGTTWGNPGMIYRMTPAGSVTVLHHFANAEGGNHSIGGLVEGSDGYYYGTNSGNFDGDEFLGSVFRISASGGFETLHLFHPSEGSEPSSSLIVGSEGSLYGRNANAAFRVSPSGGFSVLRFLGFGRDDGLIEGKNGFLYGGAAGEIFRLSAGNSAAATAGQSVTVSTAPQMPGYAGVTATLTNDGSGIPAVTVQNFPQDPGTSGIIDVGGEYVDLKVTGADLGDTVTANFYYPTTITGSNEINLQLFYFTGSAWAVVRSSGSVDPLKDTIDNLDGTISGGRFAVLFDATSTPKVTELTGTVFTSSVAVSYGVCLLYDPTKAHKKGSTIPIKIQLCDGVRNLSAADVGVTALGVVLLSSNAPGTLEDSGNANSDSNFRYDASLGGSGGYIYNLSSGGLQTGTYALRWKAGADQVIHTAGFQVR